MSGTITNYRSVIIFLVMGIIGLLLIAVSQTFHLELLKVDVEKLVAEIGALILIVGILHWFFDLGLRQEMLREVAGTVVGSTLLHDSGLESCKLDSKDVDERAHWSQSANLTIGNQYSPKFFKDFHDVLKKRCERGSPTTVLVIQPDCAAAGYLRASIAPTPDVKKAVDEILSLLDQVDKDKKRHVKIAFHDRVLRYSFIQTDESIWIKFFTNSSERVNVPALKVRSDSQLFDFFKADVKRLLETSRERT
jgi:hypothetical protein